MERNTTQTLPPTVNELVELEQREKLRLSLGDKIADLITTYAGSMVFVWLNFLWFVVWIGLHVLHIIDFDPFPFSLLTMVVSLEAIFLSVFVLISENRQAQLSDKRARLDLQVNVIAEREITKLVEIVTRLEAALGGQTVGDAEVEEMQRPTHIQEIAEKMDELEKAADSQAAT